MKTKISHKKALSIVTFLLGSVLFMQTCVVFASNVSTFYETIAAGVLAVDIVDNTGAAVGSPSVNFGGLSFNFDAQNGTGTLGTNTQRIRVYNPTLTDTWTVSLAATSGSTAVWDDGSGHTYDYNDSNSDGTDDADSDSVGGRLTVNPSAGTLAAVAPCSSTTNISKGTSNSFQEVATAVSSISLLTAASGAPTNCRWDFTGVALTQVVPAAQASGTYSLSFTLTIV